jgi:hypothetical protein
MLFYLHITDWSIIVTRLRLKAKAKANMRQSL